MLDLSCLIAQVRSVPEKCHSFGIGLWHGSDSKVFVSGDPGAERYANNAYKEDTGLATYLPYPTGWTVLWSGDVARFLGMDGGRGVQPRWRSNWTIDDAAIGTFLIGLDICRVDLACPVHTDLKAS